MNASTIWMLPRLIDALEHGGREGAEAINHFLGARTTDEYAGVDEHDNIVISAGVIAGLIKGARGDRVQLGRIMMNPSGPSMDPVRAAVRNMVTP